MTVLVQSQYLIEDLTNTIENQIKAVNDIQVHHLVRLVPQDIVAINRPQITSKYIFI